jgi:hypothetical protein
VIHCQVAGREGFATILANVLVSSKNIQLGKVGFSIVAFDVVTVANDRWYWVFSVL